MSTPQQFREDGRPVGDPATSGGSMAVAFIWLGVATVASLITLPILTLPIILIGLIVIGVKAGRGRYK